MCKETKPISEFYPNKQRSDGLSVYCKSCKAERHRMKKYGLEPGQFQEMLNAQNHTCPLCLRPLDPTPWNRSTVVDHCHSTDVVRGILCISCNRVLGYLENENWYQRAADYLGWE